MQANVDLAVDYDQWVVNEVESDQKVVNVELSLWSLLQFHLG